MKIIVTTSNNYLHLIPVFEWFYKKYWNDANIELVGYDKPETSLPFHSMGKQGDVSEWSTDLRKYFEMQDDSFIWLMEDTIIRSVDRNRIPQLLPTVGKFCLTNDVSKRDHSMMLSMPSYVKASPVSRYRLSTQPSIWRKEYLLKYLTDGLTPWQFETQDPMNDGWNVYGMVEPPLVCNEGVRKHDRFTVDLNKCHTDDIAHIKNICTWLK